MFYGKKKMIVAITYMTGFMTSMIAIVMMAVVG